MRDELKEWLERETQRIKKKIEEGRWKDQTALIKLIEMYKKHKKNAK